VWGKDSVRPHYLFWSCLVRVIFGGGGGVAQMVELSHKHFSTIAWFEAAHFRFHKVLWRVRRQSVRLLAEPTSSEREQPSVKEAEVDHFSTAFDSKSETCVAHFKYFSISSLDFFIPSSVRITNFDFFDPEIYPFSFNSSRI